MTALQTAMVKRIELHDARILAIQLLLLSGASPTHAAVGGTSAMNLAFEHDKQEFVQLIMAWKKSGQRKGESGLPAVFEETSLTRLTGSRARQVPSRHVTRPARRLDRA